MRLSAAAKPETPKPATTARTPSHGVEPAQAGDVAAAHELTCPATHSA